MKACAKIGAFLALVILAGDTLPTRAKTIAHITIVIIVKVWVVAAEGEYTCA